MRTLPEDRLLTAAFAAAAKFTLDPALVCAVIEQESSWNPWAIRFEEKSIARYIAPVKLKDPTEAQARAFSYGLMQVAGFTARDFAFKGKFLSELCDAETNLDMGCRILAFKIRSIPIEKGLLAWNGGANKDYPAEVLARKGFYESLSQGRAG